VALKNGFFSEIKQNTSLNKHRYHHTYSSYLNTLTTHGTPVFSSFYTKNPQTTENTASLNTHQKFIQTVLNITKHKYKKVHTKQHD
jgi:hypothetical protein